MIAGSHVHQGTQRLVSYRMHHSQRPALVTWTAEIERHPRAALHLSGAVQSQATVSAADVAKAALHGAIDRLNADAL